MISKGFFPPLNEGEVAPRLEIKEGAEGRFMEEGGIEKGDRRWGKEEGSMEWSRSEGVRGSDKENYNIIGPKA